MGEPAAGKPARQRGFRQPAPRPEERPAAGGGLCLYPEGRRHQPACRAQLHRLCLCHPLCRRQPDGGLQGEQPHRPHRPCRGDGRDHRGHPRPGGQRPQPRLAQDRAYQRGQEQDPQLVQEDAPGGEYPAGTGRLVQGTAQGDDPHPGRPAGRVRGQLQPPPAPEQRRRNLCRHRLRRHDHCQLPAQAQGRVAEAQGSRGRGE